jgi:hypothetical protein
MTSQPALSAAEHLLISGELATRPTRRSRVLEENQAMAGLIGAMARDAEAVLMTVTDTALRLCSAGSTGISLLEDDPNGGEAISGSPTIRHEWRLAGGQIGKGQTRSR